MFICNDQPDEMEGCIVHHELPSFFGLLPPILAFRPRIGQMVLALSSSIIAALCIAFVLFLRTVPW